MTASRTLGRFLISPLGAVVVCGALAGAAWLAMSDRGGKAPAVEPGGGRGVVAKGVAGRPKAARPGKTGATGRDEDPASRKARALAEAEAAADAEFRRFGPADETPVPSTVATATPRLDAIGPRDPRAEALANYKAKPPAGPEDIQAHKLMAAWCDERGLWDEAKSHWEAIVRIDPKNEAARKRLGFRLRAGQWAFDAASLEDVAQKKADAFWGKELGTLHRRMHLKGADADRSKQEASTRVEAVGDERAASALWNVFAGDPAHHALTVRSLGRFKTAKASQMLAALAVYSRDEKSRAAAVEALRGRKPVEYGERLVGLMNDPMRHEVRQVALPGGGNGRMMFIEGQQANYEFLYPKAEPSVAFCVGPLGSRPPSADEVRMARQFNQDQAAMAKMAVDQQIESDRAAIENINASIRALNGRIAGVLNGSCEAGIGPDPEDARRWLARTLGSAYRPEVDRAKPTIAQVVSPLYTPSFVSLPAT